MPTALSHRPVTLGAKLDGIELTAVFHNHVAAVAENNRYAAATVVGIGNDAAPEQPAIAANAGIFAAGGQADWNFRHTGAATVARVFHV